MTKKWSIIATVVILCAFGLGVYRTHHSRSFDPQRWQDAPAIRSDYRVHAVDDLLSRYQLQGMSRSAILALLGEPGSSPKGTAEPQAMVYRLGAKGDNFFIDDYWLVIRFDENGIAREYDITTD